MERLFKNKSSFDSSEMKKEIKESLGIEVSDNEVLTYYQYLDERKRCQGCKSLECCSQNSKGFYPLLKDNKINYVACSFKKEIQIKNEQNSLVDTLYLPKKVLEASLSNFYLSNESRKEAFKYATNFISDPQFIKKGMYISGEYKVGKTYLMASIANALALSGYKTLMIYFPDLARDLKSSINDGSLEEKVNMLKTIDVLMIDDIGSEMMTPWFRDEIFGPILQYRVLDEKPVFFTSNLELEQLMKHLLSSDNDKAKATRIAVRIKELTKYFSLEG